MRHTTVVTLLAVAFVLAAATAFAAPPQMQAQPADVHKLTKAQVEALPPAAGTPRLHFTLRHIAPSGQWHGPDLVVADPPIPAAGNPGMAGCTAYPWYPGLVYAWKIKNAGEQATTGPASVQITCTVGPDSLPANVKASWDQRLCGCMRRNFPDRVPAIPAGKTYGDAPLPVSTLISYISIPTVAVPGGIAPCESGYPHARVTVTVMPRPEEGPATGNNSTTIEFCN